MKKRVIVASLLVLSVGSFASENAKDWFMGVDVGSANINATYSEVINSTSYNGDLSDTARYITLKAGKYIKNNRFTFSYATYDIDFYSNATEDMEAFSLGYDYMFKETSKFTPFIGINIQQSNYDIEVNGATYSVDGLTYGIGIGTLYEINKNIDMEVKFSYNKSSANGSVTSSNDSINIDEDYTTQIGIGINYNF